MDKTKSASEQFGEFLNDKASKTDVSRIIKTLTDFVKEAKNKLETLLTDHKSEVNEALDAVAARIAQSETQTTQRQDQDKETMYSESRTLLRLLEDKIAEVKALIPQSYDDTEVRTQLEETRKIIPSLPDELSAEAIRNKLELFAEDESEDEKVDPRTIRGLAALIEEVEQLKKKSGGSSQMLVSHWPIAEEFTMDGIATSVTLQQAPAAQGTAIYFVDYNGQGLRRTQYTVDGNKITFVDFVPEAGTIISTTYQP